MIRRFFEWRAARAERLNKERRLALKRDWRAHPYGGGAAIDIPDMTRVQAVEHCAKTYGNVTYTDEIRGFIFYKPFGWKPPGS